MNYYDYWKLDKRPFDNVPDPVMYFDGNPTLDDAVAEILFGIKESEECLIVLAGGVGLGKTLSLRLVLDELDTEKYSIAFINNPAMTFNQLLREIVGQLTGEVCKIRSRDQILEQFNSLLFAEADKHRRVVIFIDEANVLKPADLQNLRLLTTMQEDDKNLFTLILAGQPILAKRLESREMQNLTQRIGVYCELEPFPSCEVVGQYINTRLQKAGAKSTIFSEDAILAVWYITKGVPRLINRLCNLCLKVGQTYELDMIDDTIVNLVAQRLPEAKSFMALEPQLSKKAPEVLKDERAIDIIKPEEVDEIDISMLPIPEKTPEVLKDERTTDVIKPEKMDEIDISAPSIPEKAPEVLKDEGTTDVIKPEKMDEIDISTQSIPEKTPEVLKDERTTDVIKPEEMDEIDISMLPIPEKAPEVLKSRRGTIGKITPKGMAEIDISILSLPKEIRKLAGRLAAESLKREGKSPGTAMEEWNRLRYQIAQELLNA